MDRVFKAKIAVRWLAVAALILTVLILWYSHTVTERLDEVTGDLVSFNGFNASIFPSLLIFYIYYGIQITALVGLIASLRFAKFLFLANIVGFAALTPFMGVAISLPIEVLINTLIAYLYGGIAISLIALRRWPQDC